MAPPYAARRHAEPGGAGVTHDGGAQRRTVPFARPALGTEEEDAVLRVLRSGWLTTGEEAAAFEAEFAKAVDSPYALAVSSATAALHLALEAADVGAGDLVATPAYSFVASAHAIRHAGAEPLFVDIGSDSLNVDPEEVVRACEQLGTRARDEHVAPGAPRVAAVLPVHVAGLPCDTPALEAICRRFNLPLVEDAAHAFPVDTGAGFAGAIGDFGAYSFYANKTITTGEGGMLVCREQAAAARARSLRLHGIDRQIWQRQEAATPSAPRGRAADYDVTALGYKYNLPDLAAAIGREQLRKANELAARRRQIANRYHMELVKCRGLLLPLDHPGHSWHLFVVQVDESAPLSRDQLAARLAAAGIATSVHFPPLHTTSYYRGRVAHIDWQSALRRTELCARRALSLPLFPTLTDDEQSYVIAQMRALLSG